MLAEPINGVHLPHNPKASPLYGLVEDHFDAFERAYDDRQHLRFDRRLLGFLCSCADAVIQEMMHALTGDPRPVPGVVGSIHTYGDQAANWHPHSHLIVSDGVFLPDGSFHRLPPPDPQQLMPLFRHKLLRKLLRLHPPISLDRLSYDRHNGTVAYRPRASVVPDAAGVLPC